MTNRTLNRENAVRPPPQLACIDIWRRSGGVLRIEEWDFQLPGGATGMSPWLREGASVVPFWGMGWFCHYWAVIKFLTVLLTFSDTSPLGRLGHLVAVF